jgi:hypothetical protein
MVASTELVNAEAATKREQQLAAQRAEQAEHARQVCLMGFHGVCKIACWGWIK